MAKMGIVHMLICRYVCDDADEGSRKMNRHVVAVVFMWSSSANHLQV